jgi:hypothetical protein
MFLSASGPVGETVTDADIEYFDKLDQLAELKIIDCPLAAVANPSTGAVRTTLYVLGARGSSPPDFYLRSAIVYPGQMRRDAGCARAICGCVDIRTVEKCHGSHLSTADYFFGRHPARNRGNFI